VTPDQVNTLLWLVALFFGGPIIALGLLVFLEIKTLRDDKPNNHVTAVLRRAFKKNPGAVFLAVLVWLLFLTAVGWGLAGHFFFR